MRLLPVPLQWAYIILHGSAIEFRQEGVPILELTPNASRPGISWVEAGVTVAAGPWRCSEAGSRVHVPQTPTTRLESANELGKRGWDATCPAAPSPISVG